MKQFFSQLLKDKDGNYSLRELAIALLLLVVITSWAAKQFFERDVPDFMFYAFTGLIGAGCFGYSFEKKTNNENN
jgi:multisubunit Na+/H+ antiporter MnhB subunit